MIREPERIALLAAAIAWPLMRMLHDLEAARVQLDVLATRDELTGIYNRRQFLVLAPGQPRPRRDDRTGAPNVSHWASKAQSYAPDLGVLPWQRDVEERDLPIWRHGPRSRSWQWLLQARQGTHEP